jgi:succinyl-CoA synthetase beta subunit
VNLHEYQAKELLRAVGVPIPPGEIATTPEAAEAIAQKYGTAVMVKAQVHAWRARQGRWREVLQDASGCEGEG